MYREYRVPKGFVLSEMELEIPTNFSFEMMSDGDIIDLVLFILDKEYLNGDISKRISEIEDQGIGRVGAFHSNGIFEWNLEEVEFHLYYLIATDEFFMQVKLSK